MFVKGRSLLSLGFIIACHFSMLKQDTFSSAKTRHFFLFSYCRKCILFEIKIIKDYTGTPLGVGVLGGENHYISTHTS